MRFSRIFDDPGPPTRTSILLFQGILECLRTSGGPTSSRVLENPSLEPFSIT